MASAVLIRNMGQATWVQGTQTHAKGRRRMSSAPTAVHGLKADSQWLRRRRSAERGTQMTVNLANRATHGGSTKAGEDDDSSDSSYDSDEEAATRRDHQLDERRVAESMLQLVNMLEKHPHAMGRLKELVDRHLLH